MAFDLGTGALIFVLFMVSVPRISVNYVPIFKTFLYQLIGLSQNSLALVFACSPRISLNLGGSASLQVSRNGREVMFSVFIMVASCTSERLNYFFSSLKYSPISGML